MRLIPYASFVVTANERKLFSKPLTISSSCKSNCVYEAVISSYIYRTDTVLYG